MLWDCQRRSAMAKWSLRPAADHAFEDAGRSDRIGTDHLAREKVSMTQNRYMSRRRVHGHVVELLDPAGAGINDE
jgi:hypothetical protein